ncbi:hypothetical protein CXF85_22230 [Colwellia sp. 75C3]|uniref:hypothetical protein n=1 Tax=Colwellia sp. 75C3 TaxID=888425 RepID=UPI000C325648|nr:hypothetical protein [Colwellia sp. 75C3]PKG80827.1 hypothetical protein CXF85_22230 [Colwellia sp. 75C3]
MASIKSLIYCLLIFPLCSIAGESVVAERPKADLLQSKLNTMMQNTASWLDNIGDSNTAESNESDKKNSTNKTDNASANGYLQLSWLPRTGDLDDVDAKFKVYFNLPEWNDRLALIIDNDDEDELLLDYETDNSPTDQSGVNVALQYVKQFNEKWQIKNRLGVSRKQLYLRSEIQFNWHIKDVAFRLQPRLDYFLQDGWGPSVKGVINYPLEKSYFSLSASWQKLQNESRSRRKVGFFHIKSTGRDQILVTGVQYNKSNNKLDIANENYVVSTRYRNLLYKSWMYFEVEPFIEFNQLNDFRREVGIAFNLISYYGD